MKITHLPLTFGAEIVYDDCSFQIEPGNKVGIVGVNGAGKTTLFRLLLGEQTPDSGEVSLPELRLAHLPQEITIPSDQSEISVWDYIAAGRPIDNLQNQLNVEYKKLAKYPESQTILNRTNNLQDQIDSYDLNNFDYELLKIVEEIQLSDLVDRKMHELSGGQKSKVAFARVLFENAGLLLLDEPTNHLDVDTKQFVTNFLRHYQDTVLIISHDIDFLNQITTQTLFINKTTHKIKLYPGNYTIFRRQRAAEQAAADAKISAEEREIKRLSEFVARARATKRSNTKLIKMGHQREKVLAKKLNELETREQSYAHVNLDLSPTKQSGRTPLEVQNLSFAYPNNLEIYNKLSFRLDRGEKFLIVGENGAGKSTLLKLIVGQLRPSSGSIILNKNTTLAYYAQELELLDPRRTILENVASYDFTDTELRGLLANFLFQGDSIHKKVNVLSPGEKARVALCKVLMQRANLVLLDEPTNHFDPETQKIIGQNLRDYSGTMVMVSHNPDFVEQIGVTRMLIVPPFNHTVETTHANPKIPRNSAKTSSNQKKSVRPKSQLAAQTQTPQRLAVIKNYSPELLEYYYYLNSDLI